MSDSIQNEVNEYLDNLRESGVVNMWGAGEYIQDEFGLTHKIAGDRLIEWMRTFSERHKTEEN